jgi:tRNA threonylcarbamoyladenosine biosynthesis protein TsaB
VHVLILSFDTSSPSGSIAVLKGTLVIGVVSTETDETYSSRIFRQLEFLLCELHLRLESFDLFAVNAGPGSFTGLRVGLTTAKAWADAFSKPAVPVSGLEAVAMEASGGAERIIPVIDARRGQLYVGSYKRPANQNGHEIMLDRIAEDTVMSTEEFLAWLQTAESSATMLATTSPLWLESTLCLGNHALQRFEIREVSPVLAPSIGRIAHLKCSRGEAVDALRLDANYVRRSDAELNWKGK